MFQLFPSLSLFIFFFLSFFLPIVRICVFVSYNYYNIRHVCICIWHTRYHTNERRRWSGDLFSHDRSIDHDDFVTSERRLIFLLSLLPSFLISFPLSFFFFSSNLRRATEWMKCVRRNEGRALNEENHDESITLTVNSHHFKWPISLAKRDRWRKKNEKRKRKYGFKSGIYIYIKI